MKVLLNLMLAMLLVSPAIALAHEDETHEGSKETAVAIGQAETSDGVVPSGKSEPTSSQVSQIADHDAASQASGSILKKFASGNSAFSDCVVRDGSDHRTVRHAHFRFRRSGNGGASYDLGRGDRGCRSRNIRLDAHGAVVWRRSRDAMAPMDGDRSSHNWHGNGLPCLSPGG